MNSCRLCEEDGGSLIWSGRDCRIVQVSDPNLPGFCRVIWHHHAAEMSDLTDAQKDLMMRMVFGVEEVVARCMHPAKINLASLGNQVPHLHWHVIPRYTDDPFFPGSIWSEKLRDIGDEVVEERRTLAGLLPGIIQAEVGNWMTQEEQAG